MMIMRKLRLPFISIAALSLFGCASVPPRELVDARASYRNASNGPAIKLAPSQLDSAKKALDRAEKEFQEHPKALETRDYAYIAHRQAQLAGVKASTEQSSQEKLKADRHLAKGVKDDLATSTERNRVYQDQLEDSKDQLDAETKARIEAEAQADALMAKLEKNLTVNRQVDRVVISLPGSVLFASGKSTLLSGAPATLDRVVDALREIKEQRMITIEGHTDSVGSDDANQALSISRANSVRNYLDSRGINAHFESTGFGESLPIGDNSTEEGRATNRRVEIIVSPYRP